jgi:hypothetical protein
MFHIPAARGNPSVVKRWVEIGADRSDEKRFTKKQQRLMYWLKLNLKDRLQYLFN